MLRKRFIISGQVQGVGFRPFIFRLATNLKLDGFVENGPQGVLLEAQGTPEQLNALRVALRGPLPPLARIESLQEQDLDPQPESGFVIRASQAGGNGHRVLVSPDMAVCANCLAEMTQPDNRRHAYAFTNCTDCGPRYSITRSIPYDRPATSMACFPLCPQCLAEYQNPHDRRFHAQPNACPICGPELWLEYARREPLALAEQAHPQNTQAILACVRALEQGAIAAIKGLGGFHLACNAFDQQAIARLRLRKNRPHKALAVMVPDLDSARHLAWLDQNAEQALLSQRRPIVICPRRPGKLPAALAPDTESIGLVLPYTPLHYLLFRPDLLGAEQDSPLRALVMTSGNAGGKPICLGNREAKAELSEIADLFLLHNRDILVRVDDSVVMAGSDLVPTDSASPTIFMRRARGYVPEALDLPCNSLDSVLAVGAELKHTFCLTRGRQAFVSQHIGDLHEAAALEFFQESLAHLLRLLEVQPQAVVADLHPDYLSSQVALDFAQERGLPLLRLQHHFAHVYALMAEHGLDEPVLGLSLDGSGLGADGTIWGGELLLVRPEAGGDRQERLGRLRPFALPGGEAAIRAPWRIAESLLQAVGQGDFNPPWHSMAAKAGMLAPVREMLARGLNCPLTSSCGRLFDALAALCGLCFEISYEGQAAILLEQAQNMAEQGLYLAPILPWQNSTGQGWELDSQSLFSQAVADRKQGLGSGRVARRFHLGLSRSLAEMASLAAQAHGVGKIVLGGGVLNNRTLITRLRMDLAAKGLQVFLPENYPAGDGAISLGQAYFALRNNLQ